MSRRQISTLLLLSTALAVPAFVGCAKDNQSDPPSSNSKAIAAYCPYLPSQTFSSSVTVSGKAAYEYRKDGNGAVVNGVHTLTPSATLNGQSVSLSINGTPFSFTCSGGCTATAAVTSLKTSINADTALPVTASGTSTLVLTPDVEGDSMTLASLVRLTDSWNGDLRPIRRAEIRVVDTAGNLKQCGETDDNGEFTITLPANSGSYQLSVTSRASNAYNTAYVMNNPTENQYYSLSAIVTTASNTSALRLIARATGDLMAGAFNILDQIYEAQKYLRTQTASCNSSPSANYYPDCDPFVSAPMVNVYWTAGISPGTYFGISGGISFYLNGKRELYILGGINGDTDNSDMDHFDNSVIIHEYGHFIEDQFASPNSPGGSHNGNSIIDPRLAWGEGWANFFQAAVTGSPVYRDTYGHTGCTSTSGSPCTGVAFNEDLDPAGGSYSDKPIATGEGNFREFSVTRLLWDVVKPSGTSKFSEIWTAFHGPTLGMKVVNDPFKSIGRFHAIQQATTGAADWTTIRSNEKQLGSTKDYGREFTLDNSCGTPTVAMTPVKGYGDDGSFAKSDQLVNNDFYRFVHTGGAVTIELTYDKPSSAFADLDLYVYKEGYVYGRSSDMAAVSNSDADRVGTSTQGKESASASLSAGIYMINVMAYTGVSAGSASGTNYSLKINGTTVCPN